MKRAWVITTNKTTKKIEIIRKDQYTEIHYERHCIHVFKTLRAAQEHIIHAPARHFVGNKYEEF